MRVRLHARPAVAVALVLAFCTPSLSRSFDTPKALLINLPKHEERLRTVKEQLERAEVTYERAPAVDGRGLTIEENEREVTALARNLMTPGMIGCFLSHRNCWRRCLELNSGPIIVFEDDVVLADNFTAQLHAALEELPDDWDVLLLGALGAVHPSYYLMNCLHAMMAGGLRWPKGASQFFGSRGGKPVAVHVPLRPFGTHAYVLSERGAKKLLAAAPRASYHVDVIAWGLRSLRLYAVHPLLAKQTHGDTTIGGQNDRTWLPEIIIDPYTGTDFAWAWNAPLMQFGGRGGLLITSGRCVGTTVLGVILAALLRHYRPALSLFGKALWQLVLGVTLSASGLIYALLTALIWPQRRLPALQPSDAAAASTQAESDGSA